MTFRQHLTTLVAVFVALAVGIVLGGGLLSDVTVPGADEQVVTALTERIAAAGGAVTARYDLTETMVGPDQKTLVDTLGSQLMTQQGDAIAAEATTYDRIGQLLGLAVATATPEGEATNGKGRAILESLAGADLVTAPADVERRAPLVLPSPSPRIPNARPSWLGWSPDGPVPPGASWSPATPPTAARDSSVGCAPSPSPPRSRPSTGSTRRPAR